MEGVFGDGRKASVRGSSASRRRHGGTRLIREANPGTNRHFGAIATEDAGTRDAIDRPSNRFRELGVEVGDLQTSTGY